MRYYVLDGTNRSSTLRWNHARQACVETIKTMSCELRSLRAGALSIAIQCLSAPSTKETRIFIGDRPVQRWKAWLNALTSE